VNASPVYSYFKYYVHDHLYSPVALTNSAGSVEERYEYDAYGNCHILEPNFADDPDGQSDYGNPYLFTGRRLDILDNGSLKLQYNRNRYYDQYTGRWLTHDPLGYIDGMNAYEYGGSNPVSRSDPFGLRWFVWRNGWWKALAVVNVGPPDTIEALADKIRLEVSEWRKWLTLSGNYVCTANGRIHKTRLTATTPICPGEKFKVPNTILTYWAGEFDGFGKKWVNWRRDVRTLQRRGYKTDEHDGWTGLGFNLYISAKTRSRELQGVFFWGHGFSKYPDPDGGLVTDPGRYRKTGLSDTYRTYFKEWYPKYKIGVGVLFACFSNNGGRHFSTNAFFKGYSMKMWPVATPPVSRIVPPGH